MATAPEDKAKDTGSITRWWWVRHAPVPNPEGRCYGQFDKDCDVSNEALFRHQAKLLPKGAVWYSSNLLRARKTAEHLGRAGADFGEVLIDPDLAKKESARVRFRREATAAAHLRSAHVVQILDHGIDGDQPFIVMELLDGEDLFERLAHRSISGQHVAVSAVDPLQGNVSAGRNALKG